MLLTLVIYCNLYFDQIYVYCRYHLIHIHSNSIGAIQIIKSTAHYYST